MIYHLSLRIHINIFIHLQFLTFGSNIVALSPTSRPRGSHVAPGRRGRRPAGTTQEDRRAAGRCLEPRDGDEHQGTW